MRCLVMTKSTIPLTLFIAGWAIGLWSCGGSRARAKTPAPEDSLRAVTLAIAAFQAGVPSGERLSLVVQTFERDSAGVLITLVPEPLRPGGGGRVRITKEGSAKVLERFE